MTSHKNAAPEAGAVAWRHESEAPSEKGWYAVRRADGSLCIRAWGNGRWWIPLVDGWLSDLPPGFAWFGPLAPIDWDTPRTENTIGEQAVMLAWTKATITDEQRDALMADVAEIRRQCGLSPAAAPRAAATACERCASGLRDGYALVPVSTELLSRDWPYTPLYVRLEPNDDGTHTIMLREAATPRASAPEAGAVEALHAAASDLRFVASGGQCDPETLRAHADALLALAAAPRTAAPDDDAEPVSMCENGCGPATTADRDGVPLCDACGAALDAEVLQEIATLVGFDPARHDDLTAAVREQIARAAAPAGGVTITDP